MQIPLSVEIYKLNNAPNASQSQMTIKGKLFGKKKLVGSTPFKLADSSQKSNFMTTMEFLCKMPYDDNSKCLVKGPVTSTTVFKPISEAPTVSHNESNDENTNSVGDGKFLQIIVNKKLHTNNKAEFVNEMLIDLTHYCNMNSEYQCRISVPIEVSNTVTVNINMVIFSTLGNQLVGRRSGSLDLSRHMNATNMKDLTNTSPSSREEEKARSPSEVSPKVSPQITRVLSADLEDNPINNSSNGSNGSNGSNSNVNNSGNVNNSSSATTTTSPNNYFTSTHNNNHSTNGVAQDFFKRRAELNSGRSRAGSSPIALQHTPQSPPPYQPPNNIFGNNSINNNIGNNDNTCSNNSNIYSDSSSLIETGIVPNREESIDLLRHENQQLKSVLQRAKVRFQEIVSENSQLKERIKQLEDQMALLETSPISSNKSTSLQKDLLDFF